LGQATLSFSALLGVTWLFATLVIAFPRQVAFEWLFSVGCGLQGTFLFWFYCLRDKVFSRFSKHKTKQQGREIVWFFFGLGWFVSSVCWDWRTRD
jgi:hypothetical protein